MRLRSPLAREIVIVLLVKLVLIIALKLAFFSDPLRPDAEATARRLLTVPVSPTPDRSHPHE